MSMASVRPAEGSGPLPTCPHTPCVPGTLAAGLCSSAVSAGVLRPLWGGPLGQAPTPRDPHICPYVALLARELQ